MGMNDEVKDKILLLLKKTGGLPRIEIMQTLNIEERILSPNLQELRKLGYVEYVPPQDVRGHWTLVSDKRLSKRVLK
jgi:Mn-dependent DtxR family transcriptional regulator